MLVLSRKPNQKIQIGNEITITVVKVRGNVIRLGIDAPRDVRVIRAELDLTVDEALTSGISTGLSSFANTDDSAEANDGSGEEPLPSPSNITATRYSLAI